MATEKATIPHTSGKCPRLYASRANGPIFVGPARARSSSAASFSQPKYVHHSRHTMTKAAITSLINAQVRSASLTAVAATIKDSPSAMITKRPCRSLKCAGRMSQSRPSPLAPLPAASRSAAIAANQIQFRAGGSTNAPASTSVSPMSDNEAQISHRSPIDPCALEVDAHLETEAEQADHEVRNHEPEGLATRTRGSPTWP